MKINVDPPKISSEEIAAKRDFNAVLSDLNPKPTAPPKAQWYKNSWFASGMAALVIVIASVIGAPLIKNEGKNRKPIKTQKETAFAYEPNQKEASRYAILPPIKGTDIAYTSYKINASAAQEILHPTGTKLTIAAKSFQDEKGAAVEGDIEIRYREFHTPSDVFLAGIPMDYDSAGIKHQFETAGMMQISAHKNGKELVLIPEKPINVELASYMPGKQFNVYVFDAAAGKWECKGKDVVTDLKKMDGEEIKSPEMIQLEKQIASIRASIPRENKQAIAAKKSLEAASQRVAAHRSNEPQKPIKATKGKYVFALDVNPKEFPEILAYQDVLFEVSPTEVNFNESYYSTDWDDISFHKLAIDSYSITLHHKKEEKTFNVYPVYKEEKMGAAMEKFKEKFAAYEVELAKRIKWENDSKKDYEEKLKESLAERNARIAESTRGMNEKMQALIKANLVAATIRRQFFATRTGIWNCDQPMVYPSGVKVFPTLADAAGKRLELEGFYLVENGRNATFRFMQGQALEFNPGRKGKIWGVTLNNELARFDLDGLTKEQLSMEFVELRMKLLSLREGITHEEIITFLDS